MIANAAATPQTAMMKPASAGPTSRETLKAIEFEAMALGSSSFVTEARYERHTDRHVGTLEHALDQRRCRQHVDIDIAGDGERRQDNHVDRSQTVDGQGCVAPVDTIGDDTKQRTEHHGRRELRERDDAHPQFRARELPRVPADSDAIDPQPVQRYGGTR